MEKDFHILSLSGGGFRGLFTAKILAGLEEMAGKPIAQCFDLICGTSIGGMIAMGLGIEKPAREISNLIRDHGADIFSGRRFYSGIFSAKHDNHKLREVVQIIFGNKKIGDSKHKILVPAINHSTGNPRMFKTWWKGKGGDLPMMDAVMATTAAPCYFPIWKTQDGNSVSYLDGGLFANAPGLLGVHEAVFRLGVDADRVHLLSIGTMESDEGVGDNNLDIGIIGWMCGGRLFNVISAAQGKMAHFMLDQQLGSRYCRIDSRPSPQQSKQLGLDSATPVAADILSSAAQSEVQNFIGSDRAQKWLEHVPAFDNNEEKSND